MESKNINYFLPVNDEDLFIGEAELKLIKVVDSSSTKNEFVIGELGKGKAHYLRQEMYNKYLKNNI
ncbi:hypothetical protein [Priestia megaterium]|uniref:hypothetical protein n=1 Tax=Priestia megaterium TaxID=1404 RepID=UPI0039DFDF91